MFRRNLKASMDVSQSVLSVENLRVHRTSTAGDLLGLQDESSHYELMRPWTQP